MNRRTFLTSLGVAMLTVGAGCASDSTEDDIMSELTDVTKLREGGEGFGPKETAVRFIDRAAGVVLYWKKEGYGGGLTAIPISETNLE